MTLWKSALYKFIRFSSLSDFKHISSTVFKILTMPLQQSNRAYQSHSKNTCRQEQSKNCIRQQKDRNTVFFYFIHHSYCDQNYVKKILLVKHASEKLSRVSYFFLSICFLIGVVYNLSAFIFKFYLTHMRYQIFGIFKSVCAIALIFMHVMVHLN